VVVLLIGQQGVGKSTLGHALQELRSVRYVSGGALIRREIAAETEIGLRIRDPINAGERIPPELMYELLGRELDGRTTEHLVLDGFPLEAREHGEMIAVVGEPDAVLLLDGVPTDELVQRIERRLECPKCYRTFVDREQDRCPDCDAALEGRPEDADLEKIQRRHRRWVGAREGLIGLYDGIGILTRIDARRPPDEVRSLVLSRFEELGKPRR
jgi:adenylate kinase